jgi:hypothetical protein
MQPGTPNISFCKGQSHLTDAAWHSLPLTKHISLMVFGILQMQPGTPEISFFKGFWYITDAAWHLNLFGGSKLYFLFYFESFFGLVFGTIFGPP